MSATRHDIPVAGGELAVYELGAAAAEAPTVLAVHGITANSHSWVAVARALGGGARLLAIDLRGRGRSNGLPGPFGLDAHSDDLLAVLDALELDRVTVAGHSLGAYIAARFTVRHPGRVTETVLVDGGLQIPGLAVENPRETVETFLGPAVARLELRFETADAYVDWWRNHPAFAGSDIADADLRAYVEHDLVGEPPQLRSSVSAEAVFDDGADLLARARVAEDLTTPAILLCAPRGLQNEPTPMQPFELARAWAQAAPDQRRAVLVPDMNHYTLALGEAGARAVAGALLEAAG